MYSLTQSKRIRGASGEPIPSVFETLEARGTRLLRGQLALVAAGPGTGKSAFVLTWALKARQPCIYFSADSDAFTQLTRAVSILCGWDLEESSKAVLAGELDAVEAQLDGVPIRLIYDASPTLGTIEHTLEAWFEIYEDWPSMIVVDNITNVRGASNEDDPFSGLESLMDYLHQMARQTQACVVGLHHVTGEYNDANKPIPLSGVKGQITRVPETIMTLHKKPLSDEAVILCVSTVKQRGGKADPSGNDYAELLFVGKAMKIEDLGEEDPGAFYSSELDSEHDDDPFAVEYRYREEM